MGTEGDGPGETRVGGFDAGGRGFVLALLTLGGGLLGLGLPYLARWAAELPWVPFQGPLRLLGSIEGSWLTWGWPLIGAVVGLAAAVWIVQGTAVLVVADDRVRVLRRGEVERVIRREQVDGVHRRGSKIVIENAQGRQLFADDVEGDAAAVRDAFVAHGYPWEGAEPSS
ncbi:hypothetical protein ICW40_02680 [Actinotalea ferrariae]|uniref:YqeB family protein n=1 Tax=Actinotalea ferrariae TaxID=1386098 RepID=UPI001C8C2F6B|nr:hypothetical protein [Actinotalea ferrariae]MBX9243709.1 hypothetical protein [Actinotalea ferrariae]